MNKTDSRRQRGSKTSRATGKCGRPRLVVYRTGKNIYAQLVSADNRTVLTASSTLNPDIKKDLDGKSGAGGNIVAAKLVGRRIAEKALANNVDCVAFDRNGYKYHGRVMAVANAAREAGLKF